MNKYTILQEALATEGRGQMRAYGNSMTPIIYSGSLLTFERRAEYEIDDIVFCRVKGRFIDAHKIVQKTQDSKGRPRYLIANNHGWKNGWTTQVFGKVAQIEPPK